MHVTMCTSIPLAPQITRDLMAAAGRSAASWVALAARANISSAAGMSSPVTWWWGAVGRLDQPTLVRECGTVGASRAARPGGMHVTPAAPRSACQWPERGAHQRATWERELWPAAVLHKLGNLVPADTGPGLPPGRNHDDGRHSSSPYLTASAT